VRVALLGALALAALAGCPNQYADPMAAESGNPDCGTDALAKLIAGRAKELSDACRPTPVKQCADILKDPVMAKWKPRFDAWEGCQ
jgi:hypothetical protein